jgi:cytochrome b pre-mRNA-processing protein 3
MFGLFRRDRQGRRIAATLYGAIVAQSRNPLFFSAYGVADTIDGRFEMIVAHLVLVLRWLKGGDRDSQTLGQRTFDIFCQDMDRSLREMGTGDLAVPKRMREIGEAFYGRAETYGAALADGDADQLAAAVARNIGDGAAVAAAALANYMIAAEGNLAEITSVDLGTGTLPFPQPGDFVKGDDGRDCRG